MQQRRYDALVNREEDQNLVLRFALTLLIPLSFSRMFAGLYGNTSHDTNARSEPSRVAPR